MEPPPLDLEAIYDPRLRVQEATLVKCRKPAGLMVYTGLDYNHLWSKNGGWFTILLYQHYDRITFSWNDSQQVTFYLINSNNIYSDILSGILLTYSVYADIPSGILSDIWHLCWHSFWHVFGSMRAHLHPELSIGLGSVGAQTQSSLSFWQSTHKLAVGGREEERRGGVAPL